MTASRSDADAAVAARLARYDRLLEVGIGRRRGVAAELVDAGKDVTAVDVDDCPVPDGVTFRKVDVVERSSRADPGSVFAVEAIYGVNLPPELHRPTLDVARTVDAAFLFTTLGYDEPAVSVSVESIDCETVYVARDLS